MQEVVELEKHKEMTCEILSKRALQIMLRVEELEWADTEVIQQ